MNRELLTQGKLIEALARALARAKGNERLQTEYQNSIKISEPTEEDNLFPYRNWVAKIEDAWDQSLLDEKANFLAQRFDVIWPCPSCLKLAGKPGKTKPHGQLRRDPTLIESNNRNNMESYICQTCSQGWSRGLHSPEEPNWFMTYKDIQVDIHFLLPSIEANARRTEY